MGIIEVASLKPSQIFSLGHPHLHSAWAVGTVPIAIVLSFSHPFPSNSRLEDPRCGLYFILVSPNQLSGLDQGRCSVEGLRTGLSFLPMSSPKG